MKNEEATTPGPWFVSGGNSLRVWHRVMVQGVTDKRTLASVSDGLPESMANARLMAAAPELLAALTELTNWVDTSPDVYADVVLAERVAAARAAIAKAEGRG